MPLSSCTLGRKPWEGYQDSAFLQHLVCSFLFVCTDPTDAPHLQVIILAGFFLSSSSASSLLVMSLQSPVRAARSWRRSDLSLRQPICSLSEWRSVTSPCHLGCICLRFYRLLASEEKARNMQQSVPSSSLHKRRPLLRHFSSSPFTTTTYHPPDLNLTPTLSKKKKEKEENPSQPCVSLSSPSPSPS